MSRKEKKPVSKPSKAYLVSFGDTMTALLAFFIVLNSLAKDQTGAKMYSGTGSFVNAIKSIGVPGDYSGDRSGTVIEKTAPSPVYAVRNDKDNPNNERGIGPDDESDKQRILDRQSDQFQRFLNEMERQFSVNEYDPTRKQIVLDSWERLGKTEKDLLGEKAIHVATEAISQIGNPNVEIELIVWADMPSPKSIQKAMDRSVLAQQQIDRLFNFTPEQRSRVRFSAKPWLFVDSKRPITSVVVSKMASR